MRLKSIAIAITLAVVMSLMLPGLVVAQTTTDPSEMWTALATTADFGMGGRNIESSAVMNNELYVGVEDAVNACEVWKFDGFQWIKVNQNGFGSLYNSSAASMCLYEGSLYVGTRKNTGTSGNQDPFPGCQIWRFEGGTSWTQVSENGFGDSNNIAAQCMAIFNEKLYVGTWNNNGCQVRRYDGGNTWTQVNENGFGDPGCAQALSMMVYNSMLYVGSSPAMLSNPIMAYNGTDWTPVNPGDFWAAYATPWPYSMTVYEGKLIIGVYVGNMGQDLCRVVEYDGSSLKQTNQPGFGKTWNVSVDFMAVYKTKLYAVTKEAEVLDGNLAEFGTELWTYENSTWTEVLPEEFGGNDSTWITNVTTSDSALYVAAYQEAITPDTARRAAAPTAGINVFRKGASPLAAFYFAEGSCRPSFDPYICIQNPGIADAAVTITYMKGDGTTAGQSLTVAKNSRSTVIVKDTLGEQDDAAHDFSSKVECTNGQSIIAERPMYFNYKGVWTGGHDVMGITSPSTTFYFAEGTCRPNFDPYICIQNPGSTDAAIKITYMKGDGTTVEDTRSVAKNSRSTVVVKDKLGEKDDEAHDFSAKVECTNGQPIIAERPMYFNYKPVVKNWNGGHNVMGALAPATSFYFAEGSCRPDFDPYICIQNPGSVDAAVTITYMKGDGTTDTQDLSVGKNSRSTVPVKDKLGEQNDVAHDFSAKVECTNGQSIIAERPMYFNYQNKWTGGHDVVGALSSAITFYFAEGSCRPNFDPFICIQNPGGTDAAVTITYMKGDGTTDSDSFTVTKNARYTTIVKQKLGELDDAAHDFSAKVQCTNGQTIIAERPMYFNYKPGVKDWNGGHNVMGLAR